MGSNPGNKLSYYLELCKLKIMVPVTLTGFTGFFMFDPRFTPGIFIVSAGILLLAISASVLNQLEEIELDRKMKRTRERPLPAGNITIPGAISVFIITLLMGTALIYSAGNPVAAFIGLVTILWYNGIYTPLKRLTAFAVFPGAITGALPPLIGWVAAGGTIWDKSILFVAFLFFTGQIPHFWLLIMRYGEEYEQAGIPSLSGIFTKSQINRLTFTWVVTTIVAALFLCHFGIIKTGLIIGILVVASLIMIWQFSGLLKKSESNDKFSHYSFLINSYFLLLLLLLVSDRLIV